MEELRYYCEAIFLQISDDVKKALFQVGKTLVFLSLDGLAAVDRSVVDVCRFYAITIQAMVRRINCQRWFRKTIGKIVLIQVQFLSHYLHLKSLQLL